MMRLCSLSAMIPQNLSIHPQCPVWVRGRSDHRYREWKADVWGLLDPVQSSDAGPLQNCRSSDWKCRRSLSGHPTAVALETARRRPGPERIAITPVQVSSASELHSCDAIRSAGNRTWCRLSAGDKTVRQLRAETLTHSQVWFTAFPGSRARFDFRSKPGANCLLAPARDVSGRSQGTFSSVFTDSKRNSPKAQNRMTKVHFSQPVLGF